MLSSIKHKISNVKHSASNIQHQTSSIKHQTSSIKHQASNIKHQTSSIKHQASSIKHQTSNIKHPENLMLTFACISDKKLRNKGLPYNFSLLKKRGDSGDPRGSDETSRHSARHLW
ncbi:hypothetical protein QUF72_02335 [Desulfobacterales bacterium HSG2]|nr:hypothetical protein [Desulfobacterales bacterium HSG2]